MVEQAQPRFNVGAAAWAAYNQGPLGRIRQHVTWHNLAPYLPGAGDPHQPRRVLEAGGGSGELAIRLVEQGYAVWLLDYAPAMLDQARQAATALPDEVSDRLTLCPMKVEDAHTAFPPGSFDIITCHTLIEYLPDPPAVLRVLCALLRDGGLLSVSFVNRHAQVLRRVWSMGDPAGALSALEDDTFCAALFGVPGVAYAAEQVEGWLSALGFRGIATCGVRVFADYVPRHRLDDPCFFQALLRLEQAVAGRAPYRALARYAHIVACKDIENS
jgi:S-adenosylmethionine-dependent methyltransferase